jgi:hypothetical protein
MRQTWLHVAFGDNAAQQLREGLKFAGLSDRVVAMRDDYAFGPVGGAPSARSAWISQNLAQDNWREIWAQNDATIAACRASRLPLAVWVSRRSAPDYCNFLDWLSRVGDLACDIIDVTDLIVYFKRWDGRVTPPRYLVTPALLKPPMFLEYPMLASAAPLTAPARANYLAQWSALAQAGSLLRIVSGTTLLNAPLHQFDPLILSFVTAEWRRLVRVVSNVLASFYEDRVHQCNEVFLKGRIYALIEAGMIEAGGDISSLANFEIRRNYKVKAIFG